MMRHLPSAVTVAVFISLATVGCHGDHQHDDEHDGDHSHGHAASDGEEGPPTLDITLYQGGLELFMEYPSFIVGQDSPLVAHLTDTRDPEAFHGVGKGRLIATLAMAGSAEQERFVAEAPQRLGVFKPVVRPTRAGAATLTLQLEGEQASGVIHVGDVVVHATLADATKAGPEEAEGGEQPAAYFKEAQWKTVYATALVEKRVLQGGIATTGEIEPVAGQAAELAAPVAGRVVTGQVVPHVGQRVKRGELLLSLVPTGAAAASDRASVELELVRAQAELGLAARDAARTKELLAAQAVSQKQADAAAVEADVAAARVKAAEQRLASFDASQGGSGRGGSSFDLRAPLDGVVAFAQLTPGQVVEGGTRLVTIVNAERLWLRAHLPDVDVARAGNEIPGAAFSVRGFSREFFVGPPDGKLVAIGAVVDADTRTVPVVFELKNPDGLLKPGMFAKVSILTGESVQGAAVPEQAIVDDDGKLVVYAMADGEHFFKRRVTLGIRSDGYAQVLDGVTEGERVVTRGPYEIKLANSGGIPAHGHQH
ncbi:MAG: efflux RND transporter periplasmic adaptor subunit [Deltaproteobacteria bacterium]|nr:efflux RND transporter periplasmic adaptor subunit [Deltaproteobacteria bacterium]